MDGGEKEPRARHHQDDERGAIDPVGEGEDEEEGAGGRHQRQMDPHAETRADIPVRQHDQLGEARPVLVVPPVEGPRPVGEAAALLGAEQHPGIAPAVPIERRQGMEQAVAEAEPGEAERRGERDEGEPARRCQPRLGRRTTGRAGSATPSDAVDGDGRKTAARSAADAKTGLGLRYQRRPGAERDVAARTRHPPIPRHRERDDDVGAGERLGCTAAGEDPHRAACRPVPRQQVEGGRGYPVDQRQ